MKRNKKKTLINFRISSIDIIEEKLICPADTLDQVKSILYSVRADHKINIAGNTVVVLVEVTVMPKESRTTLAYIKVACVYEIESLKKLLKAFGEDDDLPSDFVSVLNSISISTTRGIMFSQFRGTYMHNNLLPIMDPKNIKAKKVAS